MFYLFSSCALGGEVLEVEKMVINVSVHATLKHFIDLSKSIY